MYIKFFVVLTMFVFVFLMVVSGVYKIGFDNGLNKGQAPYSRMKAECEQELPRNEYCVLTAVRSE